MRFDIVSKGDIFLPTPISNSTIETKGIKLNYSCYNADDNTKHWKPYIFFVINDRRMCVCVYVCDNLLLLFIKFRSDLFVLHHYVKHFFLKRLIGIVFITTIQYFHVCLVSLPSSFDKSFQTWPPIQWCVSFCIILFI